MSAIKSAFSKSSDCVYF